MFVLSHYHNAIISALKTSPANIVINAGPGSGKTTTSVELIIPELIRQRGAGMALAFNTSNAKELQVKLAGHGGNAKASSVHSFCFGVLKASRRVRMEEGWAGGYHYFHKRYMPPSPSKIERITQEVIPDSGKEYAGIMPKVIKALKMGAYGLKGHKAVNVENVAELLNDIVNEQLPEEFADWAVAVFNRSITEQATIDFEDQIYFPMMMEMKFPEMAWLVYDEGQDLKPIELELLKRYVARGTRVVVVGDKRQAINGFAGAMRNALETVQEELQASNLPMLLSYRCSVAAIGEATRIFPDSIEAGPNAKPGSVERITLAELVAFNLFSLGKEDACLARSHKYIAPLALKLIREKVEFSYKGAANLVGELDRLIFKAGGKKETDCAKLVLMLSAYGEKSEQSYKDKNPGKLPPPWMVKQATNIETLILLLAQVEGEGGTVRDLRQYLELLIAAEKGKGVSLSTFHSAKGMEWPSVYIIGELESPLANTQAEKEAEKCVAFVALTRSSDRIIYVSAD